MNNYSAYNTKNNNNNNNNTSATKTLSSNDPRLKEISQQIYNLLAFRNKPEVVANDLFGYYGANIEGLMKEYGYDKKSFQAFFSQMGYQFDSKGRFILPPTAPVLVKTFRDVLYTDDTDDEAYAYPPLRRG